MARPQYPKHSGPTPPPLPPISRTVGQVIAESLKLYADNLFAALLLGIPLAASTVLTHWLGRNGYAARAPGESIAFDRTFLEQAIVLLALAPFLTAAYLRACLVEGKSQITPGRAATVLVAGTIVFVPAAFTLGWFSLLGIAWLGCLGWVVPVLVNEPVGVAGAARRSLVLFRADPAHAIGGLAALVLLFYVTRRVLELLLREQAGNGAVVAAALADLVISPVVFLGAVLVYRDLVSRVGTTRADRAKARAKALASR